MWKSFMQKKVSYCESYKRNNSNRYWIQEVVTFAPPDAEIEFVDGEEQETVQLEDDTCEECSLVCQKERSPPCK
jgi:hypothetical protein